MTDEDFLKRWSRRKRAAEAAPEPLSPAPLPGPLEDAAANAPADSEISTDDEFDPSGLPSLDSITATTDVTAFLRKGVPLTLTQEALRRAWLADPAIRDFVGLVENAWDFNDPNAMPGFGPLDCTPEEVRDLVARIVGDRKPVIEDDASFAAPQLQENVTHTADALPDHSSDQKTVTGAVEPTLDQEETGGELTETGVAASPSPSVPVGGSQSHGVSVVRRTHGSALPR
jgi:hypothetical protein